MTDDDPKYKVAVSRYSLDKKILPGDAFWRDFNGSFQNGEYSTMELANAVYAGHPFTTWHKDCWRTSANYLLGQHIGLDFDTRDERSSIPYLLRDKFVSKYGALIYTTPSHKPEEPKARVVFMLDAPIHQPKNYTLAVSALLWLFGTADRQCKDPVRFFYGSKGAEIALPYNVLPLEVVKRSIERYQESGLRAKKHEDKRADFPDRADMRDVSDALKRIPPWAVEYDEWVSILMGLHAEFGEGGYALAEAWAEGYPGEVEHKWRSFHETGNVSGAVTIATVFAIAKRFGWERARVM